MDTLYKYWCSVERDWIFEWTTTAPTVCKNDSQTISDISIYKEIQPGNREVILNEERYFGKGADFFTETMNIDTEGSVTIKTISFPMDIFIYNITIFPFSANSEGDFIDVIINPAYTCGILTQASTSGDSVFNITETVIKYAHKPGWFVVTLVKGETSESLGRIIGIDRTNLTIKTEKSCTNAFSIGSLVKIDYYKMHHFEVFTNPHGMQAGNTKIGGSYIPKNIPVSIVYHNSTSNIKKHIISVLEYTW